MPVVYRRAMGGSACLLAGLLLITGCSSSGGGAGTDKSTAAASAPASSPVVTKEAVSAPKSGADVRALLSQAGLSCTSYETVPKEERRAPVEGAVDYAHCELDGEQTKVAVWKDEGQIENFGAYVKSVGCSIGKVAGKTNFDYVQGDLWTISNVTQTLADKISAATGATPVHIKCE